ncbi:hypothetical protein KEM56_005980 [Ascosphaera pollenicola]|nr:hypothetical protein KEM56_005980 [Ascosphaera pollenicola]
MKAAVVKAGPTVKVIDTPIPEPQAGEVLIKVVVAGTNPKDWKAPEVAASGAELFAGINLERSREWSNQGDDLAGYVEKVGQGVVGFTVGDRVAAMHDMTKDNGAWAEYAIAWSSTTWHIPDTISFEEAATVPLTGLSAAVSLFSNQRLPTPLAPAERQIPLIINGAGSATGAFAVKLARESNIHPIIGIAGSSIPYVKTLLDTSKGDAVVDYRQEPAKVIADLKNAIYKSGTTKVKHAFDSVIRETGVDVLREVLEDDGHVDFTLPPTFDMNPLSYTTTYVQSVHGPVEGVTTRTLGYLISRWFTLGFQTGTFTGHPYEIKKGGLYGVDAALHDLKEGKNHGMKYVVRVGETEGITATS